MEDFITCGMYIKDEVEMPIVCDQTTGDVVIQFDDMGDILLENVIVDNPRLTDGMNLYPVLQAYGGEGIFSTSTEWAVIRGTKVEFYAFKKPKEIIRTVDTSFDTMYEE